MQAMWIQWQEAILCMGPFCWCCCFVWHLTCWLASTLRTRTLYTQPFFCFWALFANHQPSRVEQNDRNLPRRLLWRRHRKRTEPCHRLVPIILPLLRNSSFVLGTLCWGIPMHAIIGPPRQQHCCGKSNEKSGNNTLENPSRYGCPLRDSASKTG